MVDKNNDKSVRDANPHDLREHFEFAHAIAVAMGNNWPTSEWRSWKDVLGNVKKAMSHLIRTQSQVTSTPSLTATPSPTTTPTTVAITLVEMDHRSVNLRRHRRFLQWRYLLAPDVLTGILALRTRCRHRDPQPMPRVRGQKNTSGPCRQLKTTKVTRVTNGPPTAEQDSALAYDVGHVVQTFCPMLWKSWKAMPEETKNKVRDLLFTNYNLEDMDEDMFTYLNRLFFECYKQWKSDLHQFFQQFDDPQVALEEGCPKELEDQQDSWKKAKANKINLENKTLLHHLGSRPFSFRIEARQKEGSKFPEIDIFANVYVRLGNELTESLHVTIGFH
ncbi:hypothetical protein D8674_000821 [Pyrus ussuriensis x Pyrus communis]|uniref:Uncharacterized protein n=1 Tax=Pyrus ussuriensis x Pyrus communis TaxID=2448454 RepID=A0A5N5F764_9ROSA|nr:hypothetical protein D8674_000821 [Pyrus ussuriensis x Pyrus communis]